MHEKLSRNLLGELDGLLTEAELGFSNFEVIMSSLEHYTKDHELVNEVTHCPYVYIFDAMRKMREETDKAFEALRKAEGKA